MHGRERLEEELQGLQRELGDWATQMRRPELFRLQLDARIERLIAATHPDHRDHARQRLRAILDCERIDHPVRH